MGTPDAKALAGEFAPNFTDTDIISLERFHVYMKLMIDGMTSLPFSAKILRPWVEEECIVPKSENKQWVLELSRQKYGVDRQAVEDKVRKWVDTNFDKGMAISYEVKGGTNYPVATKQPPIVAKPAVTLPTTPKIFPTAVGFPDKAGVVLSYDIAKPALVNNIDIMVTATGIFDGTHLIAQNGKKYLVQPNYAAKSEIVYGDTLEMYKEGESDRFRQAVKVPRKDIEGVLVKDATGLWGLKTLDGQSYPVSQTAVEFNQFKEGQKMYGIIPADVEKPAFCTLSLKRFRKDLQKQEEAQKIKTDQSLR